MGAIYQGQSNRTRRMESEFGGGVNTGFSSFDIQENETTEEYGWDSDQHPAKVTGKGRTPIGDDGGITRLMTTYGQNTLVRVVGSVAQKWENGEWVVISFGHTDADWTATNFNEKLIFVNGTDVKQWDGSVVSDLGGNPPKGKFITNDNVRVWMAEGDVIHFSAFQDEEDWSSEENSGMVQYYTPNGGDITALTEFYGDKWVFKKDSIAVIKGTNYFNFALVSVSNDIGCVNFKTIQEVGDTLFWLGENDVYAHQGGKPFPIGQKIRKYLNHINKAQIGKCCAITDGLRYYLCLVIGDATEPNIRLSYDPRYGVWQVSRLNENYRYSAQLNNVTYVGDSEGQTWILNQGPSDEWSLTTRPFDEGFPEAEKQYKELHLQGFFSPESTLQLHVSVDDRGENWIPINFNPLGSTVSQNKNCIIPLDDVPLTHWVRFRLSGTGYVELQQMQRYFKLCRVQR